MAREITAFSDSVAVFASAAAFVDLCFPADLRRLPVSTGTHRSLCPACWARSALSSSGPFARCSAFPFPMTSEWASSCEEAMADPPVFDRLRLIAIHEGVVRDLVHGAQISRPQLSVPMMARWMLRAATARIAACDAIIPVPLHRSRLFRRKFNQAAELRASSRPPLRQAFPAGDARPHQAHRPADRASAPGRGRTMCAALSRSHRARTQTSSAVVSCSSTTSTPPERRWRRRPGC